MHNAHPFQRFLDVIEDFLLGLLLEDPFGRLIAELVTMLLFQMSGDFFDVFSLIVIFGKGQALAQELEIPQTDRVSKYPHLASRIIEIILLGDLMTRPFQETRDGISVHRAPAVTHRQRTGWIGADKLDLGFGAFHRFDPAEVWPETQYLRGLFAVKLLGEMKINEARARDLYAIDKSPINLKRFNDAPGEHGRSRPHDFRGGHRDVCCEVSVRRIPGLFEGRND